MKRAKRGRLRHQNIIAAVSIGAGILSFQVAPNLVGTKPPHNLRIRDVPLGKFVPGHAAEEILCATASYTLLPATIRYPFKNSRQRNIVDRHWDVAGDRVKGLALNLPTQAR